MLPASTAVDFAAFGSFSIYTQLFLTAESKLHGARGNCMMKWESPRPDPLKMACFIVVSVICR